MRRTFSYFPAGLGLFALIASLIFVAGQATATADGMVTSVTGDATLLLDDGRRLRPAGLWLAADDWPQAGKAEQQRQALIATTKSYLADQFTGQAVGLRNRAAHPDRYGRQLAQIRRADGLWLQAALLAQGLAKVRITAASRQVAAELLAIEDAARQQQKGLWVEMRHRVRAADDTDNAVGQYVLVAGRVVAASARRKWLFINFADDYREDFTIAAEGRARRQLMQQIPDLQALAGRHLRVRGWLGWWNGPVIRLTYPEQIEILDLPAQE